MMIFTSTTAQENALCKKDNQCSTGKCNHDGKPTKENNQGEFGICIAKGYIINFGNTYNTCGANGYLGKQVGYDNAAFIYNIQQCADFCSKNKDCAYFYLNVKGWCGLYSSCDAKKLRYPEEAGSTYRKAKVTG